MTRLLVLQQLFNLSDEQMEFQLLDRMSFQRFAGLKHSGRVPDRNTIWCFRERLIQANVEHQIFAEVQRQLQQHGFRARERQIIDASIVRAPIQHNTADEQAVVKEQAVPVEWSPGRLPRPAIQYALRALNPRALAPGVDLPLSGSVRRCVFRGALQRIALPRGKRTRRSTL